MIVIIVITILFFEDYITALIFKNQASLANDMLNMSQK